MLSKALGDMRAVNELGWDVQACSVGVEEGTGGKKRRK